MLVLQRYVGEEIFIGDDVILTVISINGDKVRLGITAPIETRIDRREVRERIEHEQRAQALTHHDGREIDTRASIVLEGKAK